MVEIYIGGFFEQMSWNYDKDMDRWTTERDYSYSVRIDQDVAHAVFGLVPDFTTRYLHITRVQ